MDRVGRTDKEGDAAQDGGHRHPVTGGVFLQVEAGDSSLSPEQAGQKTVQQGNEPGQQKRRGQR